MARRSDTPSSPGAERNEPPQGSVSGDESSPGAPPEHRNLAEEELDFAFETEPEFSSAPTRRPSTQPADDIDGATPASANGSGSTHDDVSETPSPNGDGDDPVNGDGNGAGAATSFEPRGLQDPGPGAPQIDDFPPHPGVPGDASIPRPRTPVVSNPPLDQRRRQLKREKVPLRRRAVSALRVPGRGRGGAPPGTISPPPAPTGNPPPQKHTKPRMKKLRFLFVLSGLGVLAMVSTVFGMMMAVSQDLPAIENFVQYNGTQNSVMVDSTGKPLGTLTSDQNRILLDSGQISSTVKNAVVSIEDARFYEHQGIDFRGIGRALGQDVLHLSAQQGASTITQQFVKNALETQNSRTVFEKLREAALAYHLEREWSKDKILTAYLNTIYFGEGAYGIEAAARTYFGWNHPGCGTETEPCASVLLPAEAATLAGLIASPYAFDPKLNPNDSKGRRNVVLQKMYEQGYISEPDYNEGKITAVPAASVIEPPSIDSESPYFSTWVRQQLVDKYGPGKAYYGGLKVKTTLDLDLQRAAEEDVSSYLGGVPPTASVVVLDNKSGAVRAMVGGPDYAKSPFNIATNGHRQPGSSIKPFTLITALKEGISPYTTFESAPQEFHFGKRGKNVFYVSNDEDSYLGSCDIVCATTYSDNSIYAQLGLEALKGRTTQDRTRSIAKTIHEMGYRDPISVNPAMVLGGLKEGVTPLQWTYAYMTIANNGDRVSGNLAPEPGDSPVAFTKVTDSKGKVIAENDSKHKQVIPEDVATEAKSILETVVTSGTGTNANIGATGQFGKTGTTENNGDAWYCGATESATACVWVGYADSNTPMSTLYNGGPVMGGTYPALIWASVMSDYESIKAQHAADAAARKAAKASGADYVAPSTDSSGTYTAPSTDSTYTAPSTEPAPTDTAPAAPANPAPATPAAPTPTPAPTPAAPVTPAPTPPSSGGGVSGGAGPGT